VKQEEEMKDELINELTKEEEGLSMREVVA
jgi:hypothetical protein